jgi:3-hydroxyacyl-[acyl-carrier-protein] dehydratase
MLDKENLDNDEIIDYLEITPPFLMIDHVKKIIPGKSCYAVKKLNKTDWFFNCHLKREQLMPGALQIEAMLQTLVLTIYTMKEQKGKLCFVTDISTKLISKVTPESKLNIYAELISFRRGIAKGIVKTKVNNQIVNTGEFTLISPHEMPIPRTVNAD